MGSVKLSYWTHHFKRFAFDFKAYNVATFQSIRFLKDSLGTLGMEIDRLKVHTEFDFEAILVLN